MQYASLNQTVEEQTFLSLYKNSDQDIFSKTWTNNKGWIELMIKTVDWQQKGLRLKCQCMSARLTALAESVIDFITSIS